MQHLTFILRSDKNTLTKYLLFKFTTFQNRHQRRHLKVNITFCDIYFGHNLLNEINAVK